MTGDRAAWDALGAQIRRCVACEDLASTRTTVVVGQAPPGARLALVGEAPGAAEDASGEPFVGRAGQLLDGLLGEAGLARSDVAVVNTLKCRPPRNRAPKAGELARCRGWLDAQLTLLAPTLIVAMGSTAVCWFHGRNARIGLLRGGPQVVGGRDVLVTYHPSAALRFGPRGAPMLALRDDLALAARLVA